MFCSICLELFYEHNKYIVTSKTFEIWQIVHGLPFFHPSAHEARDFKNGATTCKPFLNHCTNGCTPVLFLVAFFKLRHISFYWEGMLRSCLWPGCLSGENTISGFPQAVCLIPKGTDFKYFKGTGDLEKKWKAHLCPQLCVSIKQRICGPGLLAAPGVCRRVRFQSTLRALTLRLKYEVGALICNRKTASTCLAESLLLMK